jgi:hypothetical protein
MGFNLAFKGLKMTDVHTATEIILLSNYTTDLQTQQQGCTKASPLEFHGAV